MKLATGSDTVDQMQEIHFEGNVTPHTWYQNLLLKTGKPDLIAIALLGDITYWYRPTYVYDETTGQIKGIKKKFRADLLQRDYESFEKRFGFSKKQIRAAFDRLEEKEIIKRHFRTIDTNNGGKANNVLFIELNVEGLKDITYSLPSSPTGNDPITLEGNSLLPYRETPSFPNGKEPIALEGNTNTETSLEISKESNTTTKTIEPAELKSDDDVDKLANRFIELRAKGVTLKIQDYQSIARVLAVVPLAESINLLENCFHNRKNVAIHSFSYCEPYIIDRYREELARKAAIEATKQDSPPHSSSGSDQVFFEEGSEELRLAHYLLQCIRENNPEFKEPDIQEWAKVMQVMIVEDKRDPQKIAKAIDWCQNDSFWKVHILSAKKLREKYDRLVVAAYAEQRKPHKPRNIKRDVMPKWYQKEQERKELHKPNEQSENHEKSFEEMLEELRQQKQSSSKDQGLGGY